MYEQYADDFKNYYDNFPDGKLFRISFDPLMKQMKVISLRQDLFNELREAFSVNNDAAFFTKQYGYSAPEKKYVINKFGYFAPGLIFEILNWFRTNYGSLNIVAISKKCLQYIADIMTPLKGMTNGKAFEIVNVAEETGRNDELRKIRAQKIAQGIPESQIKEHSFEYRDYQKKSVEALMFVGHGRGLIEIPTSGGKSFIISNFIWNLHKNVNSSFKVMIFVPNTQLVEQFYKDLIDYGYDSRCLAKFTGGMKKKERELNDVNTAKIIIANRQYVHKNKNALPKIDVLICDEVHQCNASSSAEFIANLEAKIKIGCSGTLPKTKYEMWSLLGMFAKVVYKENVVDLQDRGFISKLKITVLDIFHKEVGANRNYLFNLDTTRKYHPDEEGNSEVLFNDAYNAEIDFYQKRTDQLYAPVFDYLNKLDENILVLFDRIETGKSLFELAKLKTASKRAFYIDGQTDVSVREDVRKEFENSGNNILVGNVSILGTGINIKRLNHICFLISTKSFSRVIQSIGRTLRLHSLKSEAHLIDCVFNFKYSQKHYHERLKMYKDIYNKSKPDEILKFEI